MRTAAASLAGSVFFYVVTNAFAWLSDPGYVKNFAGLIQALTVGLPSGAQMTAGFLAVSVLALGERYEAALRLLDIALERARREGHAARQGIIQ